MLLCSRRYGPEMPLYLMYFPALFPSMQVNRRAAKAVVGRLAHGARRVVKAGRAAPAGRGATGVEEHGGIVWAGARRKRTMPLWRQLYNFRRTALVGRRRRDACIPGPLCYGGRDYLSVVCLVLTHACVVVRLVVTFLPLTCLLWPSCT